MAASTTLLIVLLSTAFLICAFVPHASAASYNITNQALLVFPDINTCMQASIDIVANTNCSPRVLCSADKTLFLAPCGTNTFDLLSLNATYCLDVASPCGPYRQQGLAIFYTYSQLLWTFSTADDLLNFYSAAIYNTTCNIYVDKTALHLVMTISSNDPCTFPTLTLLPFASFIAL